MNDTLLLSLICLMAMVSPGPDFLMVSRNALRYPPAQALATAAGIVTSCAVHSIFCILGLALIIAQSVLLYSTIKYLGACYLIHIGLRGIFSKSSAPQSPLERGRRESISMRAAFLQGFFCNFLNPKLAVFLLSLFTQFIPVDATLQQKVVVASVFLVESALYWPLVVMLFQLPKVRGVFLRGQAHLDRVFGALLIGMGIKVAISRD